jgi:hypothetical protein
MSVDDFRSSNNRQDLPFVSAQQAYGEAKDREDDRRDAQAFGNDPYITLGVDPLEMSDWRTIQRYERNFGVTASSSTLDRGDAIEPKGRK